MRLRTAAKALIYQDERLLVTVNKDDEGLWYILPGGGQKHGETLVDALQRECAEEIGTQVTIHDLGYIREYIADNHELHAGTEGLHQIDFIFRCTVPSNYEPPQREFHDSIQIGVAWMTIDELKHERFFPQRVLDALERDDSMVYLGDAN